MCDQHSPCRTRNRIKTKERFVGKTCKRKRTLDETSGGGASHGSEMLSAMQVARLLEQGQKRGYQRRNKNNPEHRQGPEPRRGQDRPTQKQEKR